MYPEPDLDDLLGLSQRQPRLLTPAERFRVAVRTHPAKGLAYLETAIWLLLFVSLADHVTNPNGWTGFIVWALTIVPHEAGHIVCAPFGWLLMVAGGSIWQILFWVLAGLYQWRLRGLPKLALVCAVVTGHSVINLSRYVGDASARQMPLLFGMSADHHDWGNLLGAFNLLAFDWLLAALCVVVGAGIVLAAVAGGVWVTWVGR